MDYDSLLRFIKLDTKILSFHFVRHFDDFVKMFHCEINDENVRYNKISHGKTTLKKLREQIYFVT